MKLALPLATEEPEVPLFTGDLEEEARKMNGKRAEELGGKLSFPSKMDCPAHGISATRCKIGSVLALKKGSTCADCYALKGTFRFRSVENLMEANYQKLFNVLSTPALLAQIRWHARDRFRWMMSGDIQNRNHLLNIIQICNATRHLLHWLPTREGKIVRACRDLIPGNLTIRLSATMIDGPAPKNWEWTSTVVTEETDDTCPSSIEGGSCDDHDCIACWDRRRKNVPYLKH